MRDRYGDEIDEDSVVVVSDPWDIANCEFCDDDGMRGMIRCDHVDYAAIAKRGIAAVKAALEGK